MSKEIAKREGAGVVLTEDQKALAALYGADDFTSDDLVVSRVLLGQAPSKYVQAEKSSAGQIVGSLQHELLADKGKTLEVIPFHRSKTFRLFKPVPGGGTPKFVTEVPYNQETLAWEKGRLREVDWTYTNAERKEVTEKLMCFITWNYYVLLANAVTSLPRVISFSSTSYMAGKTLGTMILEAKKQGLEMPFKTYKVGALHTTNDKGAFYKFNIELGRATTDAELSNVKQWVELAAQGSIKVDENVEDDEGGTASPAHDAPVVTPGKVDANARF